MGRFLFDAIMNDDTETLVDNHLKTLKGEVQISSILYLNETNVQAKARFNVYMQNTAFLAHMKSRNVEYTDPNQFVEYLIEAQLIKLLRKPNKYIRQHAKQNNYKTFPFSPTYKQIILGLQKMVLVLSPLEILNMNIEETYLFCMLETLGIDDSCGINETFRVRTARLLDEAKHRLRQKEDQWLLDHNAKIHRERFH